MGLMPFEAPPIIYPDIDTSVSHVQVVSSKITRHYGIGLDTDDVLRDALLRNQLKSESTPTPERLSSIFTIFPFQPNDVRLFIEFESAKYGVKTRALCDAFAPITEGTTAEKEQRAKCGDLFESILPAQSGGLTSEKQSSFAVFINQKGEVYVGGDSYILLSEFMRILDKSTAIRARFEASKTPTLTPTVDYNERPDVKLYNSPGWQSLEHCVNGGMVVVAFFTALGLGPYYFYSRFKDQQS
jgi:hypothetical protein